MTLLKYALLCALIVAPCAAFAQSNPNFSSGQALPAASLNALGVEKADVANTTATVATNAALMALPAGQFNTVYRQGFYSAGDGGAATYHWSSTACSISGGDDGSQVAPLSGTGCLIWDASAQRVTPMIFGAHGNCAISGISFCTDDTTAIQNSINAAALAGVPVYLTDATHLYYFTSQLSSSAIVDIEGFQSPQNDGNGTSGGHNCISGLITNSDINGLVLTGPKATVQNICIQMAPGPGSTARAAGSAILLGGADQQNDVVSNNVVFYPYNGIDWGGGTAPNLVKFSTSENNVIRDPANIGISIGRNTSGGVTAGITLNNNVVGCDAGYNTNGIGIAFFDGAISYNGTGNGPNNCYIGFEIIPGSVGGNGQNVNGHFTGVLGDSSGTHYTGSNTPHELYINTTTSNADIEWLYFANVWASGVLNTDQPVYISNDAGGSCDQISFNGLISHGANTNGSTSANQTVPIVGINGCNEVVIVGSEIDSWLSGTATTGLSVSSTPQRVVITGNHIGAVAGASLTNGIALGGNIGFITVTGNDLQTPSVPVSFVPTATSARVVFSGNEGVDDVCPSVASASNITLAPAYTCFHLTGTTTTNLINGGYQGRTVTLISDSGVTLTNGTTPSGNAVGICAASVSIPATGQVTLKWNQTGFCWAKSS